MRVSMGRVAGKGGPTSVHVRPAPVTVAVWALPRGPSADTKARSSSPGCAVEKAGVVATVVVPFTDTLVSTTGDAGAVGVTAAEGADAGPVPIALVAVTVKV